MVNNNAINCVLKIEALLKEFDHNNVSRKNNTILEKK